MTDEQRGSEVYKPESSEEDRRRWWEKQRWLVPIAVVVLILAVIAVAAFLRSESEAPDAAVAEDEAAQAESEGGTQAQASPEPPAGGGDAEQQPDRETAQVCRRIVALQEEVQSEGINGMNPLDVYTELTEIERQSRGTRLASLANDAAVTVQRFMTGGTDADAVYDAGSALASAC